MVAWILAVDDSVDVKKFLKSEGLSEKNIWSLDVPSGGVKIAELRTWLKTNYLSVKKKESMVFWINGADNLSEQCQNMLLKPLEESRDEVLFVLTVASESRLLPTIVSRCRVRKIKGVESDKDGKYEQLWDELIEAWRMGPGASISLLDKWEKDTELDILNFFIKKLATALRNLPSMKRVKMLKLGLELKKDAGLMVNRKLLLGRFLLEGWKVSGLDSSS
jgi:hypothetical protein